MHPSRIFDKPIGFFDIPYPMLRVVGTLPDYEAGEAYEGRLDILNAIGECTVELLENNLPPGHSVFVDNATKQVVITWPPYSPPTTEKPGIINWDFQNGNLEGWNDKRGNSWSVVLGTTLRDPWWGSVPGDLVAVMQGIGRGDHLLESNLYPATPGQPVMARSIWDQGPSNKDNNNLWTAIGFYRADGSKIEPNPWHQWYGDRIHDRTNKQRHFSTVNAITPPAAAFKTVQLIAHRRNGRNRWIAVDNVQTSGFDYSTGIPSEIDDFYLTVKVTDSANRVAYWSGIIASNSIWFTSAPYPIIAIESIRAGYSAGSAQLLGEQIESFSVSYGAIGISLNETVVYKQYDHPPGGESVAVSYGALGVTLTSTVIYVTYAHPAPEAFYAAYSAQNVTLTTTTAYVTYAHPAPESISASYAVQQVTLS